MPLCSEPLWVQAYSAAVAADGHGLLSSTRRFNPSSSSTPAGRIGRKRGEGGNPFPKIFLLLDPKIGQCGVWGLRQFGTEPNFSSFSFSVRLLS